MQKKQQSIWTTDITPHVVNFMTMDITPDFTSEFWHQDVTHHVIGTMAVFGLVVSAFVTTVGVASVGVQTEVAFAQNASALSQTAALAMGDTPPAAVLLPTVAAPVPPPQGTTTMPSRPTMDQHMGSSTNDHPMMGMGSTSIKMVCPVLTRTIGRGSNDATTTGNVSQLQQFMANHFGLDTKDVVTGHFGSTTQNLVQKFQQEQGLATTTGAGPLTRAAIARLCNPSGKDPSTTQGDINRDNHMGTSTSPMTNGMGGKGDDHHQMGSTSPAMGTTTPPMRHDDMRQPPMPPKAPTTTPVSYNSYNGSNSAAAIEAINEISDGYGRLLNAAFSLIGL